MAKGVLFDQESAKRIAAAVRRFESQVRELRGRDRPTGPAPTDRRPPMLIADADMAADDTAYNVKYLEADGTEGATITARRPNGVFIAEDEVGFLGRDASFQHIFIPGALPPPEYDSTPTVTVGTTAETEAAQTDDWDVGDGTLVEVSLTRMAYASGGGQVLYGYYRSHYYDTDGRLTKISGETRVTIDTPVT